MNQEQQHFTPHLHCELQIAQMQGFTNDFIFLSTGDIKCLFTKNIYTAFECCINVVFCGVANLYKVKAPDGMSGTIIEYIDIF